MNEKVTADAVDNPHAWVELSDVMSAFPRLSREDVADIRGADAEAQDWRRVRGMKWAAEGARISVGRGAMISAHAYLEDGVLVADQAVIFDGVLVERGARIGAGAVLRGAAYIGSNVIIGADTSIRERASIQRETAIGEQVLICADVYIGVNVCVGKSVSIRPGAVIGSRVSIGWGSYIGPDVRIESECSLGDNCHLEVGTQMRDSSELGAGAYVGEAAHDPVDIGFADGYRKVVAGYPVAGSDRLQARITAGCRNYRISDAHRHWAEAHHSEDRALTRALLGSAEAVARARGWIVD